jgi:hypothetical protein
MEKAVQKVCLNRDIISRRNAGHIYLFEQPFLFKILRIIQAKDTLSGNTVFASSV